MNNLYDIAEELAVHLDGLMSDLYEISDDITLRPCGGCYEILETWRKFKEAS